MASCYLVDSSACEAPAGSGVSIATHCYACGEAVCRACSLVVEYDGRQRRLSHACIRDRFDEFDPRPYEHIWTLMGYPAAYGHAQAEKDRLDRAQHEHGNRPDPHYW